MKGGEVIVQGFTKVKLLLRSCELSLDIYYSDYLTYSLYVFKRFYSKTPNSSNTPNNNSPITPAAVYPDAWASKDQILKDNKGKSGVYLIFFC